MLASGGAYLQRVLSAHAIAIGRRLTHPLGQGGHAHACIRASRMPVFVRISTWAAPETFLEYLNIFRAKVWVAARSDVPFATFTKHDS